MPAVRCTGTGITYGLKNGTTRSSSTSSAVGSLVLRVAVEPLDDAAHLRGLLVDVDRAHREQAVVGTVAPATRGSTGWRSHSMWSGAISGDGIRRKSWIALHGIPDSALRPNEIGTAGWMWNS